MERCQLNKLKGEQTIIDPTESIRRKLIAETKPTEREDLEAKVGQTWNTQELQRDFEVLGFMAPFVVVRKRATNEMGSLQFQHDPRLYHSWQAD